MARVGIACITSDQEGGRCVPDVCSGDLYLYEIGPLPGAPDGTPVIDVDVLNVVNVVNVANAGRAARVGNTTAVGERADTALSELTADDAETVASFEEVYEVVSETNNTNRLVREREREKCFI